MYTSDSDKQNAYKMPSQSHFDDVTLDTCDQNPISASDHQNVTNPTDAQRRLSTAQTYIRPNTNELYPDTKTQQNAPTNNSDGVLPLVDAHERLTVNSENEFLRQLNSSSNDASVKCVSIIGNTGDGKSYTLNQVFFNGQEKFCTSQTTESCTMGVWAALDENHRTLVLDTEGRLGLSQNDNIRNRLLLKILCISDIVIFRTRAPKLPNDMFQFLSDASNAFRKFFRKELETVMRNCKVEGPISTMGPTLIVFHETQYTEVLRDHFQCQKTAVEQLKERFEKMNLTYDAYNSIEYVGIQTSGGKSTDFSDIKATITQILENNKVRSPRRLSVIFKVLKALNEKFNHEIPPDMPSTLPDDFFSCHVKCLSCGTKCTGTANHEKEGLPHHCGDGCSYNKELDNEVWKCLQCNRGGRDTTVYGKLITKGDGLVQGLLKYVWSGFVIECKYHGEIYRSRKYWYGNNEPKDVTRVEVIHMWPGEESNRLASDVTPRKVVEMVRSAGSYLFGPTKMISEMVADQVAPSYWVPNKDVNQCLSCNLQFGSKFSKHHCRVCGKIFCDTCTAQRAVVPFVNVVTPQRVCDHCFEKLQSKSPPPIPQADDGDTVHPMSSSDLYYIPIRRRVVEVIKDNIGSVVCQYPLQQIMERTRPNYWRPDAECQSCFVCKHPFNSTTHLLHHCRKCGEGVCDLCSPNQHAVPERDWFTPQRVCKLCEKEIHEAATMHLTNQ